MTQSRDRSEDALAATTPPGRGWRWPVAVLVAVIIVVVGAAVFQRLTTPQPAKFSCADLGIGGPPAGSPDEAVNAWLATSPTNGLPGDWKRSTDRQPAPNAESPPGGLAPPAVVEYRPTNPTPDRLSSVTVGLVNGSWTVVFGCA